MLTATTTRVRTHALMEECRRLCLESIQRQSESVELRSACQEAGLACRASIKRSKVLSQPAIPSKRDNLHLAHLIASALSARNGVSALVLEPSQDTATTI